MGSLQIKLNNFREMNTKRNLQFPSVYVEKPNMKNERFIKTISHNCNRKHHQWKTIPFKKVITTFLFGILHISKISSVTN